MAQVRLWINNRDNAIYDLPPVCMKCGAPSTTVKIRKFQWYPPWVIVFVFLGVWPFVIVAAIMTKRQRVEIPFCEQHKSHFLYRVLIGLGGLFGLLALGAVALFVGIALSSPNKGGGGGGGGGDAVLGIMCALWFVLLLVYAVGMSVFNMMTTIRPTSITDKDITLTNVAPEFSRAVEEEEDALERDAFRDRDRPREKRRPELRDDEDRVQRRPDRTPPRRPTDARDDD